MLFVHEKNMQTKIKNNYKDCGERIEEFYRNVYLPMRNEIMSINFQEENRKNFDYASEIFNDYYLKIEEIMSECDISSQSKFDSSFLEEISVYLFKDVPEIKSGVFGVFNKKVYAGLKIDRNNNISIITKDVDFCIGKKAKVSIDEQPKTEIILPIFVSVSA